MALSLRNTLTGALEAFESREPGVVRIFTCGPSTYRRPHIGNYRSFLYEDLLVRYLEYLGYTVHRVINFTDVEDKTVTEAAARGESIGAVTSRVQEKFFEESELLQLKLPESIPRATESVDEAVRIIQALTQKGYAYEHAGKYYFDASRVKGFGRLFGLDTSRWPSRRVRFGRDTYEGRRWNLGDFVLWHGEEAGGTLPEGSVWETEIGRGRPSWNVQDPAMIVSNLGDQIDIQCGGIDNLYRHHDYNIAVMEAYSGREFARYFLHGEHLVVNSEVMSKSKGNVLYPEHILGNGYLPVHLRYFLLHEHYRSKLNFTWEYFGETVARIDRLRNAVAGVIEQIVPDRSRQPDLGLDEPGSERENTAAGELRTAFEDSMNADLSAGAAIEAIERFVSQLKVSDLDVNDRLAVSEVLARAQQVLRVLV
ncbi:MAG: class I tRNA ligase family protein [Spirochaetales bacterium]